MRVEFRFCIRELDGDGLFWIHFKGCRSRFTSDEVRREILIAMIIIELKNLITQLAGAFWCF